MQGGLKMMHALLVQVPTSLGQQGEVVALLLSKISLDAKLVIVPAALLCYTSHLVSQC